MTEMTFSAYARHRNCSPGYVTKLKNDGRLVLAVGGGIDAEASDRLIEQTAGNRTDVAERNAAQRGKKRASSRQVETSDPGKGQDMDAAKKTAHSATVQAAARKNDVETMGASYQTARTVKEKYAALRAKAEYETLIGDLIAREDVDAAMRFIGGAVRAAFDVFPDQTAPLVAPVTDLAEIHEIITQSARDALHGIGAAIKRQREELGTAGEASHDR